VANLFGVPQDWTSFNRWTLAPFDFVSQAVRSKKIVLHTDGSPVRHYVSLDRLGGSVLAAVKGVLPPMTHLSGRAWSMRDLAGVVAEVVAEESGNAVEVVLGTTRTNESAHDFCSTHWVAEQDESAEKMRCFLAGVTHHCCVKIMNEISPLAKISPLADIERSVRGNKVCIAENVTIDSFVKIKFAGGGGDVLIASEVYLNSGVVIYSGNGVSIGRGTLIAANTTIAATNHEYRSRNQTIIEQRFMPSKGGVVIEEDCWIGANCVLLDGTVLHRGCVVGAGTVLKGEWPEYSVVAGSPAKIVRSRVCA